MKMSIKEWKVEIENDLCRCCHSEGTFKSLSADSAVGREERMEVYLVMLRNCFAIELTPSEEPHMENVNSICEPCIARLQDAHSFKEQVLKCEQIFQDYYAKKNVKAPFKAIKEELQNSEDIQDPEESPVSAQSSHCVVIVPCETVVKEESPDRKELSDSDGECYKPKAKRKGPKYQRSQAGPKRKRNGVKKRGRPKIHAPPADGEDGGDAENQPDIPDEIRMNSTTFTLLRSDYQFVGDKLQCARCDNLYNAIGQLRRHIKHKHFRIARYNCKHCAKKCRTLKEIITHNISEHGIDNRLKCNACDAIFNTRKQLKQHIDNFHMLGVKQKCPHCEYETFCEQNLLRHKLKHNAVKQLSCKYCKKLFLRKKTLDLHEKIHTNDRRKVCAECGQAFVQKASLNYHMTKYHPEVNF